MSWSGSSGPAIPALKETNGLETFERGESPFFISHDIGIVNLYILIFFLYTVFPFES